MRIVVHGQQAFGKSVLEALLERGENVVGVYCAPDPAQGGRVDPLKEAALARGLPVHQPRTFRNKPEVWEEFARLKADLCVMAYVTLIVPEEVLNQPTRGTIQYHPSLLPRHRGPSSINWPIIMGETQTGLSIFWPDQGLDTGPILLQKEVEIRDSDTLGSLYFDRLYPLGVAALLEGVDLVRAGTAPKIVQEESKATYEGWCKKEHVQIDWQKPIQTIWNLIRGADPQPGAWTIHEGTTVQILDAKKLAGATQGQPGEVLAIDDAGMTVAVAGGQIQVTRVRPEGGQKVAAAAFAKTAGLRPGVRLGGEVSGEGPRGLARGLTNYGDADFALYLRRSFATSMGYSKAMLARPVVGIAQSASGFNNCHRHFPELIDAVKRGVLAAGGLPIDFPTISLGEVFLSPTSMMFRNLMAIDVEEMIRAQPMDAVVLVGGCDKTVPAQLMGAASADVPAVQLLAGPMMPMAYRGERLGACTDCRRFWAKYRAGAVSAEEIEQIESNLATTAGTCAVMGTASTMASIAEALGMALPGTAAIPAVHADRLRAAEASGQQAVALASTRLRPSQIITQRSVENALRVLLAIGGSTNAIIHLTAVAGRVGVEVSLRRLNTLSDETPVLVDLKPTGQHYMSDLNAAGGLGAVLRELAPMLHLDCMTVTGQTLGQRLAAEGAWVDRDVVRPLADPYQKVGGLVALFGSLAPGGAILKRSAADPALFEREGRAVVFASLDDLAARIDTPDLDVRPDDFLVLQNAGPKSGYAMPEAGYLPIPSKLARAGVKDMVRISDARMSGTAYGTIVLHVSPESAVGGPLALVKNGDRIRLSVNERRLELAVDEAELARRRAALPRPATPPARGYAKLYMDHVLQAEQGCDFDFLRKA